MSPGRKDAGTPSPAVGRGRYQLTIPLDASGIDERDTAAKLKVAVRQVDGSIQSQTVALDASGRGAATLAFGEPPGALQVYVGPADASDEDLTHLQTLEFAVSPRQWRGENQIALKPIVVPPYYWYWWRRWCRTFVIRGRVLCPDGSPVPGAEVCAYDVDWFFIWSSTQLVGCTTTDITGAFELRFRWCCGWWPWWWWRLRLWRLDPLLSERIGDLLQRNPQLSLGAIAGEQPSLDVFRPLAAAQGPASLERALASDVSAVDRLREQLVAKLPPGPEVTGLRLWPWFPWYPWWDCTPDIIFKVTQDCITHIATIVDEGVGDARVNVANPLDVTLIANESACCLPRCPDPPCEGGECIIVDRVCEYNIDQVGGNLGAPAAPVGYLNPGASPADSYDHHRPFAGVVPVYKNPGDLTGVDYLEFEVSSDGGATWLPLPAGAGVDFTRRHWDAVGSPPSVPADFKFDSVSFPGHTVVETREHREGVIGGTWDIPGADHWWLSINWDLLVAIDSTKFADGVYNFHAIGWSDGGGGTLVNRRVLPVCGEEGTENELVLAFDNRAVTAPALHDPTHNCGTGIHICTVEPDTHILAVRINGVPVGPCDTVDSTSGTLEIDFLARDTAAAVGNPRHLAYYVLESRWGLNQSRNLLSQPSASVAVLSGGPSGWALGQTTGNYGTALTQGAAAPDWEGGTFRLTMSVEEAFPEPCCYQLYLEARKRTLVGGGASSGAFVCGSDYAHWNRTQYAIGVGVCGERPVVALPSGAAPVQVAPGIQGG